MKITHTRKGQYKVGSSSQAHNSLEESLEYADNLALKTPGQSVTIVQPGYEVMAVDDDPADPPVDVPPPDDAPPAKPKIVSQELIPSKYQVMVGETFTAEASLLLDDRSSMPVAGYYLGYDKTLLSTPNSWTPRFTALAPGVAKVMNSNSGTTGRTSVTIVPNDGTVFPPPDTVTPPPTDSTPPPPDNTPSGRPGVPAPSALSSAAPNSPVGDGVHTALVEVTDGSGLVWTATGHVGDDPKIPGMVACLVNADGEPHPRLQAVFYADRCKVNVARMDNPYDELGCKMTVTYDGEDVTPPSSYEDGTYDFWRGCAMPTIRYGVQAPFDAGKIDWSVLLDYTNDTQVPYTDSAWDFTWNGLGATRTKGMGDAGERDEIAYIMRLMMGFLLNPCEETWQVVVKAEDWAGNWAMVGVCEPATGQFIKYSDYGAATIMPKAQAGAWQSKNPIAAYGGSYRGDELTPPASGWVSSGCPNIPNGAHLTSYGMLAGMITGAAGDLDNASFWAAYTTLEINPDYTRSGGCMLGPQRRAAWCLRSLFIAAYHSSNTSFWDAEVDRNIEIMNAITRNDSGLMGTHFGYAGAGEAYKYRGMALWMQRYFVMTLNGVIKKKPAAIPFAQYLGKLEVTWSKYAYLPMCTIYNFICIDPSGNMMTDFDEMVKLSLCNNGYVLEDAEAIIAATTQQEVYDLIQKDYGRSGKTWSGKCVNGVCDLRGNPRSSDSYPADAIASIKAAANCGTPGIEPAVEYIEALPTLPDYTTDFRNQKYHLRLVELDAA